MNKESALLEIKGLTKYYPVKKGVFKKSSGFVKAVDGVSFSIQRGEILGLVGESGCGKTTIGKCILRAIEPTAGQVLLHREGQQVINVTSATQSELRSLRGDMQMVFQDPYSSLNPRMTTKDLIAEPLICIGRVKGKALEQRVAELMSMVGLRPEYMQRYPHAFSGGQRQRIGIARALALHPRLVICDEAVSALDVSIQAQILNLLQELQENLGLTYLFISHDLSVVEHVSNRVAVMYVGQLVEIAPTELLFSNPRHPYTERLLAAVPVPDPNLRRGNIQLKGEVADPANPPSGCLFHPRCSYATDVCSKKVPRLQKVEGEGASEHLVACHFADTLQLRAV